MKFIYGQSKIDTNPREAFRFRIKFNLEKEIAVRIITVPDEASNPTKAIAFAEALTMLKAIVPDSFLDEEKEAEKLVKFYLDRDWPTWCEDNGIDCYEMAIDDFTVTYFNYLGIEWDVEITP